MDDKEQAKFDAFVDFLITIQNLFYLPNWDVYIEDYLRLESNLKQNRISNEEKDSR